VCIVPDGQLFKLTIYAEGELRDSDGNLISNEPLTSEIVVSEEQAQAIAASLAEQEEIANDRRPLGDEPG
jgi:hypothetical protein